MGQRGKDRRYATPRTTRHVWVQPDRPGVVPVQGYVLEWRGRSYQLVLLDALAQAELVGVTAAVDRHLGRRATRVELTAARRTAARLARDGRLTLHQVRVSAGQQARGGLFLIVARPDATVDEDRLQPPAAAPRPPTIRPPSRRNAAPPPATPTKW